MKKDVIYIDIEDDITAVIGKLKSSSEKIVALVPPKGNAVLQSTVNLKLLKRAADSVTKQLVLVTSNHALVALAGGLGLYVAKNLQSKPALPDDLDDVSVDDEPIEVSNNVGTLDTPTPVDLSPDNDEIELGSEELADLQAADGAAEAQKASIKSKKSKTNKVPNFDTFKKKLLIVGGVLLLLLIIGLAIFGRSKATIHLKADTTPVDISLQATIDSGLSASDPTAASFKARVQQNQQNLNQTFNASGQKDLGTKASGTVTFSIKCSDVDENPPTIPAGTGISAQGITFITQSAANLTTSSFSGGCKFTSGGAIPVTAQDNGDRYNLGARQYTVSGFSNVSASGSQMSGGTSNIVKVVSQGDIDGATKQLEQQDTSAAKAALKKAFGKGVTTLDDSFTVAYSNVTSNPAVDSQADNGTVSAQVTYTMLAISNDDLNKALDAGVTAKMTNKDQQRVYDNGLSRMHLQKVDANAQKATYTITASGQFGPQFNTDELKSQITGKKAGEVRSLLQGLPGVQSVDINLSPFWANTMPNVNRIQIKLDIDKNASIR